MIYPNWMEPIPVTMLLLEKNGWWRDKSNTNAFIHPQLGTDNKIVFKDNVPVFHNVQIPYVHQLQNVLHEHNENISIHMQIFKIYPLIRIRFLMTLVSASVPMGMDVEIVSLS